MALLYAFVFGSMGRLVRLQGNCRMTRRWYREMVRLLEGWRLRRHSHDRGQHEKGQPIGVIP
jgi:hypothetical protein